MQVALSPFTLVGDVPPGVRVWTLLAAVLVQIGESLPVALPLILGPAATLRSPLARRLVAVGLLVTCALATHWLRPAADLAADRRMPGSVSGAPPQDFRAFTSLELLSVADEPDVDEQLIVMARGLLWMRIASVVATAILLVPLIASSRPVVLRWFVAPVLAALMIGLNLVAFNVLAPRLAAPWASMLWIVIPAVVVAGALWVALRRARAKAGGDEASAAHGVA